MKTLNLKRNSWYGKLYKYMFLRTNEQLPQNFCSLFKGIIFALILSPFFPLSKLRLFSASIFNIQVPINKILTNVIDIFCISFISLIYLDKLPNLNESKESNFPFLYHIGFAICVIYTFIIGGTVIINIVSSLGEIIKIPKFIIAIRDMLKKACSKIDWN